MSFAFIVESFYKVLAAAPLTLYLALLSMVFGTLLAFVLAFMRLSGVWLLDLPARLYIFVFRGTPLLVQLFLIYYGPGQFAWVRQSMLWPFLRDEFWCGILALTLNTGAYVAEIIRGGLLSVPTGQVEAARASGMSPLLMFRRIVAPLAIRQALPAYGNELISMVKATSLVSTITLMDITGVADRINADTFRKTEAFIAAGALYLIINFTLTRLVMLAEYYVSPDLRQRPSSDKVEEARA